MPAISTMANSRKQQTHLGRDQPAKQLVLIEEEDRRRTVAAVQPPPWRLNGERQHDELGAAPGRQSYKSSGRVRRHSAIHHEGTQQQQQSKPKTTSVHGGPAP